MITLTMYLYFFFTGKVEWNENLAFGLALFDLIMLTELSEMTLIKVGKNERD